MAVKITAKDPFAAQVTAAVRQKYGPQQRALTGELSASHAMDRNEHAWYQNYLNAVNASEQSTAAGYQDAATRIGQAADTSTNTDRSNRQQMIQALQADAAKRGASVDPGIDQTGVQAEASRRTGLDEATAATLRTGANQNAYLADKGRIGAGQEIEAHKAEAGRRVTIRQQKQQLRLDAADYGQSVRSSLTQAKANQDLAQASLGLKASSQAQTARHQNAQDQMALQRLGLENAKFNLSQKQFNDLQRIRQQNANTQSGNLAFKRQRDRYLRQHGLSVFAPKTPGGGVTRSQRVGAQNHLATARNLLSVSASSQGKSVNEVIAALGTKGIPPDIARAAYQYHLYGGVKGGLRHQLQVKYGLHTRKAGHRRNVQAGVESGVGGAAGAIGGIL